MHRVLNVCKNLFNSKANHNTCENKPSRRLISTFAMIRQACLNDPTAKQKLSPTPGGGRKDAQDALLFLQLAGECGNSPLSGSGLSPTPSGPNESL